MVCPSHLNVVEPVAHLIRVVIQLAKLAGFFPIIATASLHNTAYLKSVGATHVLARDLPLDTLREQIRAITRAPLDLVFDTIATAETQPVAYALVVAGGQLVVSMPMTLLPPEQLRADTPVKHALATAHLPFNFAAATSLYRSIPALLQEGVIKV